MPRNLKFIVCLLLFAVPLFGLSKDLPEKPNIVFILADDLGWVDVGYNGAAFYETPNIDALRASGVEFTSAYPGASNCMPSRSCIVSGMYTPRTQMWTPGGEAKGEKKYMKFLVPRKGDNKGNNQFAAKLALEPSVTSIAEVLNSVGYKTAHFGKWHLGDDTQGFDLSDPNGLGGPVKNYYGDVNVSESLSEATVNFINKYKDDPFFVYLSFWDVHIPIRARSETVAKYDKKLAAANWNRHWNTTYAAMIEAVDTGVGKIIDAIQSSGIDKETLIIFTSDNGGHSGATWCEPLKGAKGSFYEGGIRVATTMSWPGVIKANSICHTPITGVDYLPTFADLAGAALPTNQPVDGRSIVSLIKGEPVLQDRAIFWHYPLYLAGAQYNKVVPVYSTGIPYWRATPCSVIRKGDWKLMQFFEDDSIKLFNLSEDLGETEDLAEANPEKAISLLHELKAWQADTKAAIPTTLNPDFNPI